VLKSGHTVPAETHLFTQRHRITLSLTMCTYPFDAHCRHMGKAIKHPVPDRVKLLFVIFDIQAL